MTGGTWYLPSPDGEGSLVLNAHPESACGGRSCPLHAPSDHWASGMPLRWRHDEKGGRMMRLCPHGLKHDDPDDLAFRVQRGMPTYRMEAEHGACECPCGCDIEVPF